MLVLARKEGEVVQIGPDVRVVVIEMSNGRVRLGIEAPQHIAVDRAEIAARKRRESQR